MIKIAARSSKLSRMQVAEIYGLLAKQMPDLLIDPHFVSSPGDRDQEAALGPLDKTDFFTRDIDLLVQNGAVRLGIHSAKDLPEPLAEGLEIFALTKSVSPFDTLVFPKGISLSTLKEAPVIGVSSPRRETTVKKVIPDAQCREIRGTIEKRVQQLEQGDYDAIVVAEAALIRLGIHHLYRLRLPCAAAPLQGQLAVVGRKDDFVMREIFANIDVRRARAQDTLSRL